jgi:hypothetical protein
MAFSNDTIEMMMALNSFGPRFDPESIPSYTDWVANTTFDPFSPEPFSPTSCPSPGIPLHTQTKGEFYNEKDVDTGGRVDRSHGPWKEDMTRYFPQEVNPDPSLENSELGTNVIYQRSRFAFAQKRIERSTDVSMSHIPAARVHHPTVGQSRSPIPIQATPTTTSRVFGPRPFRFLHAFHAKREPPTLAVPKPVYPLPTWLTHFEGCEEELLTEFCPPPKDPSPSTSPFRTMVRVELPSERLPEHLPLSITPRFELTDSGYTDIDDGDWFPEGDDDSDEEDEDYDPSESDIGSDFGSDYVSFGSESSTPASYGAENFVWPVPFHGHQVVDREGYSRADAATALEFPPLDSPSPLPPSPHVPSLDLFDLAAQPQDSLPWPVFTNPFTGEQITTSPALPSATSVAAYDSDDVAMVDADRFLAEMEKYLGFGSGPGSLSEPFEVETEGWYDRFDLTGYTFPVLPQQPQSPRTDVGVEAPPPVCTTTIPLPDTEEDEDGGISVVVIPRSPLLKWR